MNKNLLVCIAFLFGGGCGERWTQNPSGDMAFRFKTSHANTIVVQVKSMQEGEVVGSVDTCASRYHRYSAKWIADNCILLKSSDIGYRAVVVNEKCLLYFAAVEKRDGASRVALFNEQWEAAGIEFECGEVEPVAN